jgi:hypothetical protein
MMLTLYSTGLLDKSALQLHMHNAHLLTGDNIVNSIGVDNAIVVNYIGVAHDNECIVIWVIIDPANDKPIGATVACTASQHTSGTQRQRCSDWRHCWRHCRIASRCRIDHIPCCTQSAKRRQ